MSIVSLLPIETVLATTGFARQTGEPCAACHQQSYGPWLTQYGQKFKLDGYVAGSAPSLANALNPFSLEVIGSFTATQQSQPATQVAQSNPNNNFANDWTALYYTGRITDKIGAYLQLNLNPQLAKTVSLAMADIRMADHATIMDNHITYGLTVNNLPTMSDTWMTSYAWMYPYTQSPFLVPTAAKPWLQSLMAGANTAGSTAYVMINNHLYLEAGGYTSQAQNMAQGLGVWTPGSLSQLPQAGLIDGGAPYWRAYLQHNTGAHSMMIGTYGLAAKVIPFYQRGSGSDYYTEYNIDSNYSYMMNDDNMFMAMFKYTHDSMQMGASNTLGYANNTSNYLDSVMLMGMWTYRQTYNLTLGWNTMAGSSDAILYNGATAYDANNPVTAIKGTANGSPNTNAFLVEADYVPFGKGTSKIDPYLNLRFSLQYWAYTQFNGATNNYDGSGRNASSNNTLYLVTNVMF